VRKSLKGELGLVIIIGCDGTSEGDGADRQLAKMLILM
jgi:hypothetical protein